MEGLPKQEQAPESVYDREAVHEEAKQQLQEMLEGVVVGEDVPEKFRYAVSLKQLLNQLDSETTENSLRHVVEVASEELTNELGNMSQLNYNQCQQHLVSAGAEVV